MPPKRRRSPAQAARAPKNRRTEDAPAVAPPEVVPAVDVAVAAPPEPALEVVPAADVPVAAPPRVADAAPVMLARPNGGEVVRYVVVEPQNLPPASRNETVILQQLESLNQRLQQQQVNIQQQAGPQSTSVQNLVRDLCCLCILLLFLASAGFFLCICWWVKSVYDSITDNGKMTIASVGLNALRSTVTEMKDAALETTKNAVIETTEAVAMGTAGSVLSVITGLVDTTNGIVCFPGWVIGGASNIVKSALVGSKNSKPLETKPNKPEPAKPEPAKPEPAKPEPAKPEPAEQEPVKPEPVEPEPAKPEPAKPEPVEPEPAKPEPAKPEPTKQEPAEPEPNKPEPAKQEPAEPEPVQTEPKPDQTQQSEFEKRLQEITAGVEDAEMIEIIRQFALDNGFP